MEGLAGKGSGAQVLGPRAMQESLRRLWFLMRREEGWGQQGQGALPRGGREVRRGERHGPGRRTLSPAAGPAHPSRGFGKRPGPCVCWGSRLRGLAGRLALLSGKLAPRGLPGAPAPRNRRAWGQPTHVTPGGSARPRGAPGPRPRAPRSCRPPGLRHILCQGGYAALSKHRPDVQILRLCPGPERSAACFSWKSLVIC